MKPVRQYFCMVPFVYQHWDFLECCFLTLFSVKALAGQNGMDLVAYYFI